MMANDRDLVRVDEMSDADFISAAHNRPGVRNLSDKALLVLKRHLDDYAMQVDLGSWLDDSDFVQITDHNDMDWFRAVEARIGPCFPDYYQAFDAQDPAQYKAAIDCFMIDALAFFRCHFLVIGFEEPDPHYGIINKAVLRG